MTPRQTELLDRLVELSRQLEAHRAAVWLLEQQQLTVRNELRATGWQPPEVTP